jgi:YegS/Rv2252/BmrU family lipid kinase
LKSKVSILTVNLFVNPIAGKGKARITARNLARELRLAGLKVSLITESPEFAALEEVKCDAAVVIGGDGSLRTVAAAYRDQLGMIPPLLPVPMGTANLMGKHLGVDFREDLPRRVLASLLRGEVRRLDAGLANRKLFLLFAGVGIDAKIVHDLDGLRKGPINYASYLLPAARTLAGYQYPSVAVQVDGVEVFPMSPAVAFVGNISEYGTGFAMVPDAKSDDGLLDICVIPVSSPMGAIQQFLLAAAGEHVLSEGAVYMRGKEIRIESPEKIPLQLDGDPAGETPVDIRLLPLRVPFIVPA